MIKQENIEQMRERHEAEIEALQGGCPHKKLSGWMDWAWAPGHFSGRVRICERCGRVIERDNMPGPLVKQSIDNPPRPLTEEDLEQLKQL